MTERAYVWRFGDRWWFLVTAILGLVMGFCASFIEGNNADLMVVAPTQDDGGAGFWVVLLVTGFVLVVGSLVMFAIPRRIPFATDGIPLKVPG